MSTDPLRALEFYAQNNVLLLTGCTGFVGKVILEKVLRSLPQVKKIYVLVRGSSKGAAQYRVENEIFGSRIWETLRAQFPDEAQFRTEVMSKVVAIQGDMSIDRLGLSEEDQATIQKDTTVFINSAASITFDGPLKSAFNLNTKGPLRACEIMKEMPHLKAVVQISTSYVNAYLQPQHVDEKIYSHPFGNPEDVYKKIQAMSDDEINDYERDCVLKTYPNTYTFTKSLAEHLLQSRYSALQLPLVIVRPSVIGAAISEPVPSWVEGIGAFTGIFVATALGVVQEWVADETKVVCMIPVDIFAKVTLMAAVAIAAGYLQTGSDVPIVQVGTSSHCPITFGQMFRPSLEYWRVARAPAGRISDDIRVHLYSVEDFPRRFQQRFRKELAHVAESEEGKRKYQKLLKRAWEIPASKGWATTSTWVFETKKAFEMDRMAPKELQTGLEKGVDWETYTKNYLLGTHEFVLGEEVDRSIAMDFKVKSMQRVYVPDEEKTRSRL
ncbi:cyclin-dependent kinase inhibitor far1 [Linnemannia elongata]|nr:cyclin-dependent kinase inhibitor far1 [Linnemannia elongata]